MNKNRLIDWLKLNNFRKMSAEEIIYEIEEGYFDDEEIERRIEKYKTQSIKLDKENDELKDQVESLQQQNKAYEEALKTVHSEMIGGNLLVENSFRMTFKKIDDVLSHIKK